MVVSMVSAAFGDNKVESLFLLTSTENTIQLSAPEQAVNGEFVTAGSSSPPPTLAFLIVAFLCQIVTKGRR